jgi:hypothetical protein
MGSVVTTESHKDTFPVPETYDGRGCDRMQQLIRELRKQFSALQKQIERQAISTRR